MVLDSLHLLNANKDIFDKDENDNRLRIRGLKLYADGALGSRGAWLLQPYSDEPGQSGNLLTPMADLGSFIRFAAAHQLQVGIHAIGDRAIREMINLYEAVSKDFPAIRELRWRIEHLQHIDPAGVGRMASLNIIASMQPVHCTSDAPFVIKRLGTERARQTSYVWRSLIDAGVVVCSGTDAPVEEINPFAGIYSATTR